jgi:hypothetical protein
MDQTLIILALVLAICAAVALVTDRRVSTSSHKCSTKATLSSFIPPPPVVHFGMYPTNQQVEDWSASGDVVKLRNSDPKIKTNGNDAG